MRERSKIISIARPIATVFAFLADVENERHWRRGVVSTANTGVGVGVGAVYRRTMRLPGDRHSTSYVEITELIPDRRISFTTTTGSIRRSGSYDLRAIDNGTEVSVRLSANLVGFQKLMAPLVAVMMESQLGAMNDLKRVLESRREL